MCGLLVWREAPRVPDAAADGRDDLLTLARRRHASGAPWSDLEAGLRLARVGVAMVRGLAAPEVVARARAARRALAGASSQGHGHAFELRALGRLLGVLGRALPLAHVEWARRLLAQIDPKLGEIDAVDLTALLVRVRIGELGVVGAVVDVLLATRALGTRTKDRAAVLSRVKKSLRRAHGGSHE